MKLLNRVFSTLIVIVLLATLSSPVYADLFAEDIYAGTGTYKVEDTNGKIEFVNEWSVSITGVNEKYIATSGTKDVKLTFNVRGVPDGKSYRVEPFIYFNDHNMQAWTAEEWERLGVEDMAFNVDKDGEYTIIYSTGKLIDYFSMVDYKTVVNISDIGFQFIEFDNRMIVNFVSLEDIVDNGDTATTTEKGKTTTNAVVTNKEGKTTTNAVVTNKDGEHGKKDDPNIDNPNKVLNGTKVYLYLIVAAAVIIIVTVVIVVASKRRRRFY